MRAHSEPRSSSSSRSGITGCGGRFGESASAEAEQNPLPTPSELAIASRGKLPRESSLWKISGNQRGPGVRDEREFYQGKCQMACN